MNPILSIIVPVYNVEKYIVKCISSIVNQCEFDKTELIIVNDGTKDKSIELVKPIIEGRSNVILINQENAGLSEARNKGLRTANGEYIWFVDSDDAIASNAISILLHRFETHSDCYGINLLWENEDDGKKTEVGMWNESESLSSGIEFMQNKNHLTPVQRYVVKRDILILNNLFFYPKILHEDLEYVPRLLYYVANVDVVGCPLYYYLRRTSGSITSKISEKNLIGLCHGFLSVADFTEKCVDSQIRYIYYEKLYEMFQHFIHKYAEFLNEKADWSILNEQLRHIKIVLKIIKGSLSIKDRIHVRLFMFSPMLYVRYRKSRIA